MEIASKPCQDQFLHPILVHCRKIRKIQVAKWGTQKIYLKKSFIGSAPDLKGSRLKLTSAMGQGPMSWAQSYKTFRRLFRGLTPLT